jgi:hypothetical protein
MKSACLAFFAVLLSGSTAPMLMAQQPKAPRTQASAGERAVLALEESWPAAVVKRDTATFRRLLAPGFIYTEDARTYTAEELIHDLVTSTDTVTSGHNEDM